MQKPSFDPGLTQQVTGNLRRAINTDGSFNVLRRGGSWRDVHPYLFLINASWPVFLGIVLVGYLVVNCIFAAAYYSLSPAQIQGTEAASNVTRLLKDFFFSAHTLTTVGYGNFAPTGMAGNAVAAAEALVGLMGFALATGLLFGRVSKPSARIGYSDRALIAPYQDRSSLQFRLVNRRSNTLVELKVIVVLMTIDSSSGTPMRKFTQLTLERDSVYFLALTWTVVHPIDESSPFFGKSPEDLNAAQAEILVMVKGFDETFSQTVNSRYSYRFDEIEWGARFKPAFEIDRQGEMVLNLEEVGSFAKLEG
jgi:inward rectifier potassium channel